MTRLPRPVLGRRPFLHRVLAAASLVAGLAVAAPAGAQQTAAPSVPSVPRVARPTLVLLVRHAEKAAAPANDPPLTEQGTARAKALQAALAGAGVRHVIVTPFRRTGDTARPLLDALGLTPEVVPVAGGDHLKAVADAVRRHAGEVVLVVGHSNTIPGIIGALGGPRLPDLCDAEHANLFVLALMPEGGASLVRSLYGPADPAGAASCATNSMR
jgi:broad specificity phosphatase PhoE